MSVYIELEIDDEFALKFLDFYDSCCNDLDGINEETYYFVGSSYDIVKDAIDKWPEEYKKEIRDRKYRRIRK